MDPRVWAAIIAASGALIGVFVGGYLQVWISNRDHRRNTKNSLVLTSIFVSEIRTTLEAFNDDGEIRKALTLNMSLPSFISEQIEILQKELSKYDPQIAVELLWLKQAATNIKTYLSSAKKESEKAKPKDLEVYIGWALIDIKKAIEFSERIATSCCKKGGGEAREIIKKNSNFEGIVEHSSSNLNLIQRIIDGIKNI